MSAIIRQRITSTDKLLDYPRAASEAFTEGARLYAEKVIPRHFTRAGAIEYGYEVRDSVWTRRKAQVFGHTRPLEFTGRTRRAAEAARITNLGHSARSPRGARLVMDVPAYVSGDPRRRRELEATSARDGRVVAAEMERILTEKLRGNGPAREL